MDGIGMFFQQVKTYISECVFNYTIKQQNCAFNPKKQPVVAHKLLHQLTPLLVYVLFVRANGWYTFTQLNDQGTGY